MISLLIIFLKRSTAAWHSTKQTDNVVCMLSYTLRTTLSTLIQRIANGTLTHNPNEKCATLVMQEKIVSINSTNEIFCSFRPDTLKTLGLPIRASVQHPHQKRLAHRKHHQGFNSLSKIRIFTAVMLCASLYA